MLCANWGLLWSSHNGWIFWKRTKCCPDISGDYIIGPNICGELFIAFEYHRAVHPPSNRPFRLAPRGGTIRSDVSWLSGSAAQRLSYSAAQLLSGPWAPHAQNTVPFPGGAPKKGLTLETARGTEMWQRTWTWMWTWMWIRGGQVRSGPGNVCLLNGFCSFCCFSPSPHCLFFDFLALRWAVASIQPGPIWAGYVRADGESDGRTLPLWELGSVFVSTSIFTLAAFNKICSAPPHFSAKGHPKTRHALLYVLIAVLEFNNFKWKWQGPLGSRVRRAAGRMAWWPGWTVQVLIAFVYVSLNNLYTCLAFLFLAL